VRTGMAHYCPFVSRRIDPVDTASAPQLLPTRSSMAGRFFEFWVNHHLCRKVCSITG
jgi:hypothetical protein